MFVLANRSARGTALVIATIALLTTSLPAAAGTTSCNIPQPCALFANANGPGVSGTSAKSEGVVGTTTFGATSTSNHTFGIEGIDGSTNRNAYNAGVYGLSSYGTGVSGLSSSGIGVRAASSSGVALVASSSTNYAMNGGSVSNTAIVGTTSASSLTSTHDGLMGIDKSTSGGSNDGVLGTTTNGGYGVEGTSGNGASGGMHGVATDGIGVFGQSASGIGAYGYSNNYVAVYGLAGPTGTGVLGSASGGPGAEGFSQTSYGVYGASYSGNGVAALSTTGNGLEVSSGSGGSGVGVHVTSTGNATDIDGSYIGLLGRSDSFPMVLTNSGGSNLFYVDGVGNIYAHGSYNTFVATRGGTTTTAFSARTTTQTVEDVGTAQLVGGIATVRFDPAFAASIDAHATYQVFLTPGGETHGLFVATKTAAGFVVRETESGRGTLAFDYRIVATAPGHARERMAFVTTAAAPHALPIARAFKPLPAPAAPTSAKAAPHLR